MLNWTELKPFLINCWYLFKKKKKHWNEITSVDTSFVWHSPPSNPIQSSIYSIQVFNRIGNPSILHLAGQRVNRSIPSLHSPSIPFQPRSFRLHRTFPLSDCRYTPKRVKWSEVLDLAVVLCSLYSFVYIIWCLSRVSMASNTILCQLIGWINSEKFIVVWIYIFLI